jgi:hypothetical protein
LKQEGRERDEQGRLISHHVIRGAIIEHRETLQQLTRANTKAIHSFGTFYHRYFTKGADSLRVTKAALMERYRAWCKRENVAPISELACGRFMNSEGWQKRFSAKGTVAYVALELRGLA